MRVWAADESLTGISGEVLAVGFDFATAPLADGEMLDTTGGAPIRAEIHGDSDQPRTGGIVDGPNVDGTVVTARIKPVPGDRYFQILAPTTAGNVIGARRFLNWY